MQFLPTRRHYFNVSIPELMSKSSVTYASVVCTLIVQTLETCCPVVQVQKMNLKTWQFPLHQTIIGNCIQDLMVKLCRDGLLPTCPLTGMISATNRLTISIRMNTAISSTQLTLQRVIHDTLKSLTKLMASSRLPFQNHRMKIEQTCALLLPLGDHCLLVCTCWTIT